MASNPLREATTQIHRQPTVARFNPNAPLRVQQSASDVNFSEELEQANQQSSAGGASGTSYNTGTGSTVSADTSQNTAAALAAMMTNSAVGSLLGSDSSGVLGTGTSDMDTLSMLLQSTGGTSLNSSSLLTQTGGGSSALQALSALLQNNTYALNGNNLLNQLGSSSLTTQALATLLQSSQAGTLNAGNDANVQNLLTQAVLSLLQNNGTVNGLSQKSIQAGNGNIPANAWETASPGLVNTAAQRAPSLYRAVIDQFDVENNARYAVKNGNTYCNIFLWDVTRAMDAEIPHYTDPNTGDILETGQGGQAMTANRISDWLNTHGQRYGWVEATPEQAQMYANSGRPAVTVWKNPPGHGHVQVVCPAEDGTYNAEKGVTVAQAGRRLRNYCYITDIYGSNTLSKVQYFVHI